MSDNIVILVNGEVLADTKQSTIKDQKKNAGLLARELLPILKSDYNITLLHGNKPQVGYVLYRSELASHVLHQIPLDVCGADTQGATGYMLSQSLINTMRKNHCDRSVMSVMTQTVVDKNSQDYNEPNKQIGPWMDKDRAEQRRQLYGWKITQEPGYGYRRVVPSPPPLEIVEIDGIRQLTQSGTIVVAAGGGGVPVKSDTNGLLEGLEVVVDTDHVASILAHQLKAETLLMIIEDDVKFLEAGLDRPDYCHLTFREFREMEKDVETSSSSVSRKLQSIKNYLNNGGNQVIVTTLRKLEPTLKKHSGLWIGDEVNDLNLAEISS